MHWTGQIAPTSIPPDITINSQDLAATTMTLLAALF